MSVQDYWIVFMSVMLIATCIIAVITIISNERTSRRIKRSDMRLADARELLERVQDENRRLAQQLESYQRSMLSTPPLPPRYAPKGR